MKDRPTYSKIFPDYYTRKIHFIYEKSRNWLPRSSKSNKSHNSCGFYYWKNRDLGSIFSHEIRDSEAAGVHYYYIKNVYSYAFFYAKS